MMGPLQTKVEAIEAAIGHEDWSRVGTMVAPDLSYRVGAGPVRRGLAGLKSYMQAQSRILAWIGHDEALALETEETVVIEVVSHFRRHADGAELTLPCCDIYRFRDGLLTDWRVYADLGAIGLDGSAG